MSAVPATPGAPPAVANEAVDRASARLAVASQWQLVWWAFQRHRLAMAGLVVTVVLYLIAGLPALWREPSQKRCLESLWTYRTTLCLGSDESDAIAAASLATTLAYVCTPSYKRIEPKVSQIAAREVCMAHTRRKFLMAAATAPLTFGVSQAPGADSAFAKMLAP